MTKINEMDIDDIVEQELNEGKLPIKPNKEQKNGNHLLISGLPIFPLSKVELFKKVIKNKIKFDDIHIPMDSSNQSKGYVFVRFPTREFTLQAHNNINGTMFDKAHVFKTMLLDEYPTILEESDKYKEPESLVMRYQKDMSSWLLQKQCRDQILVHNRSDINIYEHSSKNLEQKWNRSDFTDSIVLWSPHGKYMATIHDKGVALWGGEKFVQINRLLHNRVRHVSFSPNEKYLMTFSLEVTKYFVNVWDVVTGILIRQFNFDKTDEDDTQYWPDFRWSFDDVYFARKQKDKISVYQSNDGVMVDKKSIDIAGIKDFSWSSRGHLISYWVGEQESSPARVVLISLPSKKEVFTKTLFNVADMSLRWSSQDDYLAVISERYIKKKLVEKELKYVGLSASLEIYRVKEKEIPVEKIVIADKTQIVSSEWEPNGSKFALLTYNQKSSAILIYDLKIVGQPQKLMDHTFGTRVTILRWSPSGQFVACSIPNGASIEFIDGHEGVLLRRAETQNLNDIAWDPTGRYLLSYRLSLVNDNSECVVNFHSITGRLLMERSFAGLKQIMWRPRPPCLMSETAIKAIKKNMGKYNSQFAYQDEMMSNETKRNLIEHRQKLMDQWLASKKGWLAQYSREKAIRMQIRNNIDTDNLEHGKCQEQNYVLVSSRTMPVK